MMGGQVLADILMGRSQTGNAAPGAVPGLRTMSKSAPAYLRRDEPSLPFVTSYIEPVAEETVEDKVEETEVKKPEVEYGHGHRGRNTVTLDGVTYDLRNPSERQTFDAEYAKQMKAYQDFQSSKWKKETKVQVEKLPVPKEEKLVSKISSYSGIKSEREAIRFGSVSRPQRRGTETSGYSYSIGDITSAPEGTPRVISIEEKTVGTSKTPVVSVEAPGAQRVFDLGKPEDLQSFMEYWKVRPLDEKISLQVVGESSLDALKSIPTDQVKMYAFWTNPVKTYGDKTFDFSTEEGKQAWKDFATSNSIRQEPEEWSQAPGFPVKTPGPSGGRHGSMGEESPISWEILKGTRLEGAIPIAYQVYESLTKGVEQAKEYAKQKEANPNQGTVRYEVPKAQVSRYFNVQGEALKRVAAGDRGFSQKYTSASLQKMGERVAVGDMSPLARAIYLVLQSNKGITKSGLADAFGVTETDVDQAMVLVNKFTQGLVAKANAAVR